MTIRKLMKMVEAHNELVEVASVGEPVCVSISIGPVAKVKASTLKGLRKKLKAEYYDEFVEGLLVGGIELGKKVSVEYGPVREVISVGVYEQQGGEL